VSSACLLSLHACSPDPPDTRRYTFNVHVLHIPSTAPGDQFLLCGASLAVALLRASGAPAQLLGLALPPQDQMVKRPSELHGITHICLTLADKC
jgi:hypothetical protein